MISSLMRLDHLRMGLAILLGLFTCMARGQYPMSVSTGAPVPPPYTYAELYDVAASTPVVVTNTGPDRNVRARVRMRNEAAGITITTDDDRTRGLGIEVPAGGSTFTLEELGSAFSGTGGFDQSFFLFSGISSAQIEEQQLLPGPAWELCVQLIDVQTDEEYSPPFPAGCVSFVVPENQPPTLLAICNSTFSMPDGILNVSWMYTPPPAFEGEIQYRLQIVRIEPIGDRVGDANDAILSATEPFLYNEVHDITTVSIDIPDELPLDAGYHYAVRVTAFSPDMYLPVQNQGHSEVCSFLYAPEGPGGNGVLRAAWPQSDDWLPFDFVNIVTVFEPFRSYTRFEYNTTLRAIGGASLPDYPRTLHWPDGPPGTQSLVTFSGLTAFESQHLSVFHPNAGLPYDAFRRGQRYEWRTVGDFTLGSINYHGDTGEEPFGIGMGPSQPQEPADGTIVPAGNVTLRWLTANTPSEPLPPFSVVQATGSSGPIFIDGNVREHWQLEVSRRSDFSTIFHSTHGSLTGESWTLNGALLDRSAFLTDIYKDLENTASYTEEGTYYWRLHWKTDPNDITSTNYNTSDVFTFCVGHCDEDSTTTAVGDPDAPGGPCVSVCLEPAPTNTTPVSGLAAGATVRVGKFDMEVITVEGSASTFSGTGKIPVPFLNDVRIMVAFTGLRVNSDGRMVAGTVEARKDWNPASLNMVTSATALIPDMSDADREMMNTFINDGARLVSLLNGGTEIGLPIGIDTEVDGRMIVCGIVNMKFDVNRAHLDMVVGVDVPEIHTTLGFGVGDMCMTPTGLGDEGRAYLPYDVTVTGDLDTKFKFKGGASTDLTNLTYVDWNCDGFKCVQIAAEVEFDRGTVLPAGDRDEASEERVSARMKFSVCRSFDGEGEDRHETWNVMARFTMDPFEVPGAPDWVFRVEEAWLDWSTIANPDGAQFPRGYLHPALVGGEPALWKGFYMKRLSMTTPEVIGDGTGEPLGAGVYNFIVDDQSELSFVVAIENLVAINQGRIDSWAFSVDSVYMSMLQNSFQRAGLKGRIGLPINGEHDLLSYGAALGYDPYLSEFAFILEVELEDTLTAPLWIAEMELFPESFVRATLSDSSKVRAELHGRIGISTALSSELGIDIGSMPSIRMPGMRFEDLVLDSDDGISCTNCAFAYASPQKEVGGFPLSIRDLSLEFDDPTHPALVVEPMVSLSGGEGESSFAASVALKFVTELTLGTGGVERFEFRDVQFTGMHLDVDVSAMRLVGDLRITKTATKEEVKGALSVGFPMGIRGDLQACFGTIKLNTAVPINTSAQHYSYWMVDGMLYFNPGLMIMTGVGIYGFGGGAYHHMTFSEGTLPSNERLQSMAPTTPPDSIPPAQGNAGNDPPNDFMSGMTADASTVGSGPAPSGGTYREDFNTFLGIRLGLVFGTYPKPDGCNMDLTLRAEFTQAGGLQLLTVQGDIYGLVDIPERDNARITGQIGFSYANREGNEVIHANLSVMLDFVVARGAGSGNKMVDANFHTESATGKWYFIMGTPDNPGGIVVGPPGGPPLISFTNYIMVGNDSIPFHLPDPPQRIMEILGLNDPTRGLGTEEATRAAIGGARDMGPLENGGGFAFGAAFQMDMDINLAVLYATFGMALGFDLLLSEIPESMICAETGRRPGDNGWYAQGQFYAGLWGELGVQLDLLFARFRAPILSMSAAMLLQGNFPNPSGFRGRAAVHFSVLNGAITGSANFEVEDGEQCTLMAAGDPLREFQFIQDLGPKGNDVSIFDMPTASYNLPVREVLEVPKLIRPDGSIEMYRFHPYVRSFTLKEVSGNVNIPGSNQFIDEPGTSSYLSRTNVMREQTVHQTKVEVGVREEYAPFQYRDFVVPGTSGAWKEERVQSFRTGDAPDVIPPGNVDYTYPVDRQRFFLQAESNNKGRVALTLGMPYLFSTTIDGATYDYVAKFIPLGGGASQTTPIVYSSGQVIPLAVPTLENERIYVVQLLRRQVTTASGNPLLNLPGGLSATSVGGSPVMHAAQIGTPLSQQFIAANGDVQQLNLTGGNVQRAVALGANDHLLYTFRFRSSKYNTLQEKFSSLTLDGRTPARYDDHRFADARGEAEESFDEADLHGVWKNGVNKLQPLVRFAPDYTDNYYSYLTDLVYAPYFQYRTKRNYAFPGNSVALPVFPALHYLLWYNRPDPVVTYNGSVHPLISENEAEMAAAPPSTLPNVSGTIAMQGMGNTTGGLFGGIFSGFTIPGIAPTMSPWYNFGFLYRAAKYADEDNGQIRVHAITALNTPGANGSVLSTLLQAHGPLPNWYNMRLNALQHYSTPYLRHTGNLPVPAGEFPVYYNANYRIKMHFRSPIPASRNTSSIKPFTLRHEAPPVYNDGTVLY